MIDFTLVMASIAGGAIGGTVGLLVSWAAGLYGRRFRFWRRGSNPPPPRSKPQPPSGPPQPYSSAAIAFRATAEGAAKGRSKIVNPLVWEDPPEQFIRLDEGRVARGNGSGGPTTPKPDIIPKPQFPSPRVIPGDMP